MLSAQSTEAACTGERAFEKVWVALTYGVSVDAEDENGRKASRTVRYFDFDSPHTNEFVAVQQLSVTGTRKGIKPDITVFVNGVPALHEGVPTGALAGRALRRTGDDQP